MRKILASVLAGAIALSMSSAAFAITLDPGTIVPSTGGSVIGVSNITAGGSAKLQNNKLYVPYGINNVDVDIASFTGLPVYTYGTPDNLQFAMIPFAKTTDNKDVAGVRFTKLHLRSNDEARIIPTVTMNRGSALGSDSKVNEGLAPTIKLKAVNKGTDFKYDNEFNDTSVEVDYTMEAFDGTANKGSAYSGSFKMKMDKSVAYSKTQLLQNDQPITLSKANGTIVKFSDSIYDKTKIRANENVDVFFKGNYGTNKQNLRVVTDSIDALTTYFAESNVNVYDFTFTPSFASSVKVEIDADQNAVVYEYNKKTGDVTKINTTYANNAAGFETRKLSCYAVVDDEYENGNVKGDTTVVEEPTDVSGGTTTDKTNPGTGANDMVGAAAAMAVVSLIAAGAVAFKKASK